jgi:hypothetical protein
VDKFVKAVSMDWNLTSGNINISGFRMSRWFSHP